MWLLFHSKKKTKQVRGGEQFVQRCPSCGKKSAFVEVEIEENMGVFFVDVLGDKERAFACTSCLEVFDVKGDDNDAPAALPQKSARELERELRAAEQKRLADEQRRRDAAESKAVRIEDELAELKKRLGR